MKLFSRTAELKASPISELDIKWNWKGEKVEENVDTCYAVEVTKRLKLFGITLLRLHFYVVFLNAFDPETIAICEKPIKVRLIRRDSQYKVYTTFTTLETTQKVADEMTQNPNKFILC